jgi:alkaline phosphatase D
MKNSLCSMALLVGGLALAVPQQGIAANLSLGPMIGDVTKESATIWARWSDDANVSVRYREVSAVKFQRSAEKFVDQASDRTWAASLRGLRPGTVYEYRLVAEAGGARTYSPLFYFRTPQAMPAQASFVVMADFANSVAKHSEALTSATAEGTDFLAVIGDWIQRDPSRQPGSKLPYPPEDAPIVLENMRQMHRDTRDPLTTLGGDLVAGVIDSSPIHPQLPVYYIWDDHDFCQNNSGADCSFKEQALQAYQEYTIAAADNGLKDAAGCGATGDWQRFDHAGLASIFMLDARSNRVDAALSTASPTLLGACQLQWLLDGLRTSTMRWKFVLTPVPFNPLTKTFDAWGAFPAERQRLVNGIKSAHIENVVFISADIHSGGAVDDGTHSSFPEVSVPHADIPNTSVNTYCRLDPHDSQVLTSEPGTWTIGGLQDPNLQIRPLTCLGKTYSDRTPGPLPPPPYPLDGKSSTGYLRVDISNQEAVLEIHDGSGRVRQGLLANGKAVPLRLRIN